MVEMLEMAAILHSATRRSLIVLVLDEIGRVAPAPTTASRSPAPSWNTCTIRRAGVAARSSPPTTMSCTALADLLPRVRNERMDALEEGDRVVFLRRIVPGGADRSYGIHVAGLAGMPARRGAPRDRDPARFGRAAARPPRVGLSARVRPNRPNSNSLFGAPDPLVVEELKALDVESLSPLERSPNSTN